MGLMNFLFSDPRANETVNRNLSAHAAGAEQQNLNNLTQEEYDQYCEDLGNQANYDAECDAFYSTYGYHPD